ncbi:hypothetical protein ACHQM5_027339 [Ranunculus cassubicifolius]
MENSEDMMLVKLRKDLRRYKKNLRHINEVEKQISEGKSINKDQQGTLRTKPIISRLVEEFDKLVEYGEDIQKQKVSEGRKEIEEQSILMQLGVGLMSLEQVMKSQDTQSQFWEIDDDGKIYRMGVPLQNIARSILTELDSLHKNGISHESVNNMSDIVILENSWNAKLINPQNTHKGSSVGVSADFVGLKELLISIMKEHNMSLSDAPQDLQDFLYLLGSPFPRRNRALIMNHPALWDSKRRVEFIVNVTRRMCVEPSLDYRIRRWLANESELDNWFYKIPNYGNLRDMLKAKPANFYFHYTKEGTDFLRYMRRVYSYLTEYGYGRREEEKMTTEVVERVFHKVCPRLLVVLHRRLA